MPSKLGKKKRLSTFLPSATYENDHPSEKAQQSKKTNIYGIFSRKFHTQQQQAAPKKREKKSTENQLLQNCNHRGAWVPATSHWPPSRFDRCRPVISGWKKKTAGQMMGENGRFENSTACPIFSKTPWWMVLKLFSKLKSGSFTHGWWGMSGIIIHMFMDGWNGWNFHGFPTMSLNLWGSFHYPLIFNVKLWTLIMLKSF